MNILNTFHAKSEAGFTILEVVIAMALFSFGMLAVGTLASTSIKSADSGRARTQALNLATERLEGLKAVPYNAIHETDTDVIERVCTQSGWVFTCVPADSPVTINRRPFTWRWTVTYIDLDEDSDVFSSGTDINKYDVKMISVTVEWVDLFGSHVDDYGGNVDDDRGLTLSTVRST